MWTPRSSYGERREIRTNVGLVAVAIDKDKNSHNALKWAIDHLLQKGQTLILIHVKVKPFSPYTTPLPTSRMFFILCFLFYKISLISSNALATCHLLKFLVVTGLNQFSEMNGDLPLVYKDPDPQTRELFLPFRCFCTRKDVSLLKHIIHSLLIMITSNIFLDDIH